MAECVLDGGRLSAVARRRLRDAQSASISPAVSSPAALINETLSQPASGRSSPRRNGTPAADQAIETLNQFTPLVETSAVHFGSVRQLEQVTRRSVKARLSRGQVC